MPFATAHEYRLAYRLKQAGPERFVFIHGLRASKDSFDRCFDMEVFQGYTLAAMLYPCSPRPPRFNELIRPGELRF